MHESWAEKHRPRTLRDVAGNPQALAELNRWADAWERGRPTHPAALLVGPPGCGKTTAALALAADRGWGLIELNASDARSGPAVKRVAGEGSVHETFSDSGEFQSSKSGKRKLIVIDEADNLYERAGEEGVADGKDLSDRGGKRAIVETVVNTRQPIILIANDAYELTRGSDRLAKAVLRLAFRRVPAPTVHKVLQRVAQTEGVPVAEGVLEALAARSEGDVRSAVNDLQAAAMGRTRIEAMPGALGERNREATVFDTVGAILKSAEAQPAVRAAQNLDETPDFLLLWLDENLPNEYRAPGDLAAGYQWLSRADVFLGRTRRRQQFGLWGYATELMSAGAAMAKSRPYGTPPHYQFPTWLRRMSSSKGEREVRSALGARIGGHVHTGIAAAHREFVPSLRALALRDPELAEQVAFRLELDADELRYLLGPQAPEPYVEQILRRVEARRAHGTPSAGTTQAEATEPARPLARDSPPRSRSLLEF